MKGKRNALVIFVLEHMRASLVYCFLAVVCFLLYAAFNLMSRQGVRATTGDVMVLSNGLEDVDWLQDRPIFFSMTLSVAHYTTVRLADVSGGKKICAAAGKAASSLVHLELCDTYSSSQYWSLYKGQLRSRTFGTFEMCLGENDHAVKLVPCDTVASAVWTYHASADSVGEGDQNSTTRTRGDGYFAVVDRHTKRRKCLVVVRTTDQVDSQAVVAGKAKHEWRLVGGPCMDHDVEHVAYWNIQMQSNKVTNTFVTVDEGSSLLYAHTGLFIGPGLNGDVCEAMVAAKSSGRPDHPKDIAIAYFIRGHENPHQTLRLLNRIYRPHHVFLVHFDVGADPVVRKEVSASIQALYGLDGNVRILPPRLVKYMGFELLFLDLVAIRTLLNMHDMHWDYFINLSSQEYPMLSQETIQEYLWHLYGHNFLDIWCPYELAPSYKQNRIDLLHVSGDRTAKVNGQAFNRKEDRPVGAELGLGSFYVTLSRPFCASLFEDPVLLDLLSYMRGVRIPDELFFVSSILSSRRFRCTLFNTNFRFTGWGRSNLFDKMRCSLEEKIITAKGKYYLKGGSHPCILGPKELVEASKLAGPISFFANKFDEKMDSSGLDVLDQKLNAAKLAQQEASVVKVLPWLERSFPHPLHCPNYHGRGI